MTDLSPETVERMVALVRRMALADKAEFLAMGTGCREAYAEADAIAAELPDPDLLEAREVCAHVAMAVAKNDGPEVWAREYRAGIYDNDDEVQRALAAIKRGRALERGEAR